MAKGAFVERLFLGGYPTMLNVTSMRSSCIVKRFIFLAGVLFLAHGGVLASTTQAQLDQDIAALQAKEDALDILVPALKIDQAFLSVGIATATAGGQLVVPINFVPGPKNIVAVQGTVVVGSSISVVSMVPGQSAITSGKSISVSGNKFIVFGLNQTAISLGTLANLTLSLPASLTKNYYPITIIDPVASDANGNTVLLNTISGTVRVGL